jgi:hypothetical protein
VRTPDVGRACDTGTVRMSLSGSVSLAGAALSPEFTRLVLILIACAVGLALVLAALVFVGGTRRSSKRYRPGRPFPFLPVWFLAAPEEQSRAGIARALTSGTLAGRVSRPRETGGASDRW